MAFVQPNIKLGSLLGPRVREDDSWGYKRWLILKIHHYSFCVETEFSFFKIAQRLRERLRNFCSEQVALFVLVSGMTRPLSITSTSKWWSLFSYNKIFRSEA